MKKRRLLFAFIISALLTLIVGLLSGLATTYLAPIWADKPWIIYVALVITFLVSLAVSSYLFLKTLPMTNSSTQSNSPSSDLSLELQPNKYPRTTSTSQLPGKSYRELMGRDPQVGNVLAALRDPSGKWIVAVDGMGGIGKTAIAREIVDRCSSERLFDAVVWDKDLKGITGTSNRKGKRQRDANVRDRPKLNCSTVRSIGCAAIEGP